MRRLQPRGCRCRRLDRRCLECLWPLLKLLGRVVNGLRPVLAICSSQGQPKAAQVGLDPIASGPPRNARRGRPFLTEHAKDNRLRYYTGGLGRVLINRDSLAPLERCPLSAALLTQTGHRLRSEKCSKTEVAVHQVYRTTPLPA